MSLSRIWALGIGLGLATSLPACDNGTQAPALEEGGSLTVRLVTDLSVPQDFNQVEIRVTVGKHRFWTDRMALDSDPPPSFPLTVRVPWGGTRGDRTQVVAIALRKGTPVLFHRRTIPFEPRTSPTLTMALSSLCLGAASVRGRDSNGNVVSACQDGQTCRAGLCASEEGSFEDETWGDFRSPTPGRPIDGGCLDPAPCPSGDQKLPGPNPPPASENPNSQSSPRDPSATIPPGQVTPTDGGSGPSPLHPPVSVHIAGYTVAGLKLSLNGAAAEEVPEGSSQFSFANSVASDEPPKVSVVASPTPLRCTVEPSVDPPSPSGGATVDVRCSRRLRQFSSGTNHTCVVLDTGYVRCWGYNESGQTADGTVSTSLGGITSATQVGSGYFHSCALFEDSTVRCWGDNRYGQTGSATPSGSTRDPIPGLSSVIKISVGGWHTCAQMADKTLRCWGNNETGQTAGGSVSTSLEGLSGVADVAAGSNHTCVLLEDSSVRCWGFMETRIEGTPWTNVPGLSGVTQIASGAGHACARLENGTVRCWGYNSHGQCGFSERGAPGEPDPSKVPIADLTGVVAVSAGGYTTCALMEDHTLRCWGNNGSNQTGWSSNGPHGNSGSTRESVPGLSGIIGVSVGGSHGCAVGMDGELRCWGDNTYGQSGAGAVPKPLAGLSGILDAALGVSFTCTLHDNGSVRCWGRGDVPSVDGGGYESTIRGLSGVTALASGSSHVCALLSQGTVRCWGSNYAYETGGGSPTSDLPGLSGVVRLFSGRSHTCAQGKDLSLRCWGQNGNSQTGWPRWGPNYNTGSFSEPVPNMEPYSEVSGGTYHSVGLAMDGTVRCWGDNGMGQCVHTVGVGSSTQIPGIVGATAVIAGRTFSCALVSGGTVRCWGENLFAQLAGSSPTQAVAGLSGVRDLASHGGADHSCVVLGDETVRCWGRNHTGQTGRSSPSRSIAGLSGVHRVRVGPAHTCARMKDGSLVCFGDDRQGQVSGVAQPIDILPLWAP